MNLSEGAVIASLLFGSVRAAQLLRVSTKVESVNTVVLTTLARGRGKDLGNVLTHSGAALYLSVARAITEPLDKLWSADGGNLQRRLERDAQTALVEAHRRLNRSSWPNAVALAALFLGGVKAMTAETPPSGTAALGLFAATLLWLSNMYGARSLATRMAAGAMALVDGLVDGADDIRAAHEDAPSGAPPETREQE